MNRPRLLQALALFAAAAPAAGEIFELPPAGFDVIGAVATVSARHEDTLVDIARRHGLGYEDIVRANPGVNVWLPGDGTEILLPSRFVLPPGPREGIVLNLAEYRMYYYPRPEGGEPALVMTYPISIGRMDWETPIGTTRVVAKSRNPSWYPPQSVREEHAADGRSLPLVVPPGPDNPLGAYAMRLGLPGYLIHGTNRPAGVGMRVTHGCIRMYPEDIEYLFALVGVRTTVRIINEPVKIGWEGDELVMEAHPLLETTLPAAGNAEGANIAAEPNMDEVVVKDVLTYVTERFIDATGERAGELDWTLAEVIVARADGIPTAVGTSIKNAAASAASQ